MTPPAADSPWPLRRATVAYVLGWTAHTTFIFYLAPIALRLGGAEGRDAWVFAGTAVASILAALPAGWLADRFPRRRVLRLSLAMLALSYAPLVAWGPGFGPVVAATALTGLGLGILFVAFSSYVPDLAARRPISRAFGVSASLAVLASAAGPALAASVFRLAPTDGAGLVANALVFAGLALAGAALTFALPRVRGAAAAAAREPTRPLRADLAVVGPAFLLYLVQGAGYGLTLPYFTVYFLDHLGMPKEPWGYVLAGGTLASALGAYLAGVAARRHAPLVVGGGSQLAVVLLTAGFLLPLALPVLGALYVVRTFFTTWVAPVVNSLLMTGVGPGERGRAASYASLAWNIGWASGATAGGLLLARLDGAMFLLGSTLALVGVSAGITLLARASARAQAD